VRVWYDSFPKVTRWIWQCIHHEHEHEQICIYPDSFDSSILSYVYEAKFYLIEL
jgi:hypothetical protein